MRRKNYALSVGFEHLIHELWSGRTERGPTVAQQVPELGHSIAYGICCLYRRSENAMMYSSGLFTELVGGVDFSGDHILYLEVTVPEPVKPGVRRVLQVPTNLLPPIRLGEIARSDNVQSLHCSKAGELFQVHVLARSPAVRAVDLKVGNNAHWKCQRP